MVPRSRAARRTAVGGESSSRQTRVPRVISSGWRDGARVETRG